MKRVYCLYRVSTKKQVDKNAKNENDIPMQRTACHDFASRQDGWEILKEYSEKGVSGYKVSADDRDAIQELKEAALNGKFDILLVFMFDRIGRIDDETPSWWNGSQSTALRCGAPRKASRGSTAMWIS